MAAVAITQLGFRLSTTPRSYFVRFGCGGSGVRLGLQNGARVPLVAGSERPSLFF